MFGDENRREETRREEKRRKRKKEKGKREISRLGNIGEGERVMVIIREKKT